MAFHVIGAVAVKVRPDTTDFKEEAKAKLQKEANGLEVEIDLEPGDLNRSEIAAKVRAANAAAKNLKVKIPTELDQDALNVADVSRVVKRLNQRLSDHGDNHLKLDVNATEALSKVRGVLASVQREVGRSPLDMHFNTDLRLKEAQRKWQAEMDAQKLHAKVLADFDVNDFVRQVDHLQRDSRIALKPDVDKTFAELEGVEFKLNTDIDFRRDRIQKNLDELSKLNPLMLSTDPEINTAEVRKRWAVLKRELEADRIDLQFDQKRLVEVQGLLKNVDVDSDSINRSVDKLFKNMHTTLHPDVELDVNKLRNLDVNLQADIEIRKQDIAAKMAELSRLKAAVLDIDPEVNTPKVRAQFEALKKEIEAQQIELRADIDRRQRIAPLIAPVDVDVDSINRSLDLANRSITAILHPDVELDRKQLRDLDVQLDADINIRREKVQATLARLEALKPFVLSVDPNINTEQVRRQWDNLKRELNNDTVDLKADLDRQSKVRAQIAELTRNRNVDLIVRINQRSLATAQATLEALAGVNVLRRSGLLLERIGTNLDNYALKIGKIGIVLGNLSNILGSASASLITFGSQLGQLGGFALGAPAALLSLVAMGVAGKAAFEGFGDAIGGSFEAMQALPKNAQNAARALQGVWTEIQKPAQAAFWQGMGDSLATFVHQSLPQVKTGLAEVAGAMGKVFSDGLQGLTEFARKGLLGDLLRQLSVGLNNMAPGAFSIADAFVTMGDAGAKYFPRIGSYLSDMAEKFDLWIRKAESSGKLNVWMENAVDTASKLKNGVKDLVGIFGGVADAARRAGSGGIDAFASQMDRIRSIVEGPVWQGTMTTLFEGARQGAQALYQAMGPLGDTLVSLAPTLKTVFVSVGETLGNLLSSIAKAMQSPIFQGGLTDLFAGIKAGMEGFSQYLPGIADGLGSLGSILGSVFTTVLPLVGRGFNIIGSAFQEMAPTLKEVGQSLSGIVSSGLSALQGILPAITGPLTLVLDLFNALPAPVQAAAAAFILFRPVASAMVGLMGNLASRAGAMSGFTAAMSGLGGALATGAITLALVGIADAMRKTGENAEYAREAMQRYKSVAEGIHQAKVDNPFDQLGNPETQKAALAGVDSFIEKYKSYTGKALDRKSLTDLVLGVDSKGARDARARIEDTLKYADQVGGSDGYRNLLNLGGMFNATNGALGDNAGKWADARSEMQGFLGTADEVNKLDWTQWLDTAGRSEAITALTGASLEKFGRITSKNAPEIKKSLDGVRSGLKGFASEAEIMAIAVGGTTDEIGVRSTQLASALKIYGDSPKGIAQAATSLGLSGREITTIMQAVGLSAEEAADAARFGFGDVAKATGLLGSTLAANTPLLYKGSDGFTELGRALSESTGLDATFLSNTLRATGADANAMATQLQSAGVPINEIKGILSSLGIPAEQAAAALSNIGRAARDNSGAWSTFEAMEFSAALDEIAKSGGAAADKANALYAAIDKLRGGVLNTEQLVSDFEATLDGLGAVFDVTQEEIDAMGGSWRGWGQAVDDATGAIDLSNAAGRDLATTMRDLGSKGLAVAQDAFDKTYAATGNLTEAQNAAAQSVTGVIDGFKNAAKAAGLNDQEIASLLERYNLVPEKISTEVTATGAIDAQTHLAGLIGQLALIPPGVTTKVGVIDADAAAKLESLGVKVHQLADGTYEITLSGDAEQARQQVDGFTQWASTQTASLSLDARRDRAMDALQKYTEIVNAAIAYAQIDGNTDKGTAKANGFIGWINSLIGTVTTDNNTGPASSKASGLMGWISSLLGYVTTDNNTGPARTQASGLMGWISSLWGNVNTGAATGGAQSAVRGLLGWISSQSATVTVGAVVSSSVGAAVASVRAAFSANGNIFDGAGNIEKFANGGFSAARRTWGKPERHSAFITRTLRVFGEPETGGEAYIPLAMRKRYRSTQILNKVADKFGLATIPKTQTRIRQYANGGIEGGANGTVGVGGNQVTINQYYPQTEPDSVGVMRAGQMIAAQGTL